MKTFEGHFTMLLEKFKKGENFGYSRFSDGELRIMQNLETQIGSNFHVIGNKRGGGNYYTEDYKHFDPNKHQFYHGKLMEAFRFKKDNYYVGLSCRCCVGEADFKQMLEWYEGDSDSDNLTWANIFLNGNYPKFMSEFVPELKNKKVVYIVNENAKLAGLPFDVIKDFRVGPNCIVNNYDMIEEIKEWIDDNNIENHVFLFSASSLSNFMIHQLFEYSNKNTYLDIGTTLNPFMGMKGRRGYHGSNTKMCIW